MTLLALGNFTCHSSSCIMLYQQVIRPLGTGSPMLKRQLPSTPGITFGSSLWFGHGVGMENSLEYNIDLSILSEIEDPFKYLS